MNKLQCEICGCTQLVKRGSYFVCSNCSTSYSLEDARKLLSNSIPNNNSNIAQGIVCPICASPLIIQGNGYVCASKNCSYTYNVSNHQTKTSRSNNSQNTICENINYEGKYGATLIKFKTIKINNYGVDLNGTFIPVDEITGFQFKAVKNSTTFVTRWSHVKLFTVPTGTTFEATITRNGNYDFRHSDNGDKTFLTFSREDYQGFIENIWRLCYHRIATIILNNLRIGKEIPVSHYCKIVDTGIFVEKPKLFGANEQYYYSWNDFRRFARIDYLYGQFYVVFTNIEWTGGYLSEGFGFVLNDNCNIAEDLLTYVKTHNITKLSELL